MWGTHKARSTTQSSAPWTIFYRAGWLRTTSPRPSQVHPGQEATFESESFAFHPSLSWTFQLVHFQISPSPRKALSFPGDVSESREVQSPGDPLASESASHSAKPFSQALLAPPNHVTFSLGVHPSLLAPVIVLDYLGSLVNITARMPAHFPFHWKDCTGVCVRERGRLGGISAPLLGTERSTGTLRPWDCC